MTHPIYSQTTLEALTTSEVKAISKSIGAIPDGDKRVKQVWVSAIINHQIVFSPTKLAAMKLHVEQTIERLTASAAASELLTIDTYIPTPPTPADDVAFAAAMGLTYDDVFGEALSAVDGDMGDIPAPEPLIELTKKVGASHVFIALAAILSAVCIVPIGMGIVIYRSIRWGSSRFGNLTRPSGNSQQTGSIDYFPFPA